MPATRNKFTKKALPKVTPAAVTELKQDIAAAIGMFMKESSERGGLDAAENVFGLSLVE